MLYGISPNGKQKYRCRTCGRQSCENPAVNGYTEERKDEILRAYQERSSLRGLERTCGVSRNTVTAWLKKKGLTLPPLHETLVPPDPHDPRTTTLELDELWSFVTKKTKQAWIWIALCRKTRQVIAYAVGQRDESTCRRLWDAIPPAYRTGTCSSDFWSTYAAVIPDDQHEAVGKETGETAHVERWNNTLRQRLGRFIRKTLSFSKSLVMHALCLRLFLHRYNMSLR
jgi:insertion element IS1 protein InsB